MKSNIRKIGNSRGVVIPPAFLAELKLDKDSDIEIELKKEGILIKPVKNPREEWEQVFEAATYEVNETESDYFNGLSNDFDDEEWTW
ncbi:MAG: AbrB/MazE/SpoVT family DNA-binding domain-containing protein [Bacteroidales bacterium]|nr:AbrB/MazE/SpoVT family DNA-binding domain-containing protein [Bacteroidales bacterium]